MPVFLNWSSPTASKGALLNRIRRAYESATADGDTGFCLMQRRAALSESSSGFFQQNPGDVDRQIDLEPRDTATCAEFQGVEHRSIL